MDITSPHTPSVRPMWGGHEQFIKKMLTYTTVDFFCLFVLKVLDDGILEYYVLCVLFLSKIVDFRSWSFVVLGFRPQCCI